MNTNIKVGNENEKYRVKQDKEYISSMDKLYERYLRGDN